MKGGRFPQELANALKEWENMHLPFAGIADDLRDTRCIVRDHITGDLNAPAKRLVIGDLDKAIERIERTIGVFSLVQLTLVALARNSRRNADECEKDR